MGSRNDHQPQQADTDQGSATHERFIEQLQEGRQEESRSGEIESDREQTAAEGSRRLVEDREQHDEAEKNSEQRKQPRDGTKS
jgi:hypothetical protein